MRHCRNPQCQAMIPSGSESCPRCHAKSCPHCGRDFANPRVSKCGCGYERNLEPGASALVVTQPPPATGRLLDAGTPPRIPFFEATP
jgi:hypothetical protein